MKDGFVRVAAVTPGIRVADPRYNADRVIEGIDAAAAKGAGIIVFPEMVLSGYTCGDLLLQHRLIDACKDGLKTIAEYTSDLDVLVFVGLPYYFRDKLYSVAAAVHRGLCLGIVPKTFIPAYSEFYETRYFTSGNASVLTTDFFGTGIPFGTHIIFENGESLPDLKIACEICEDAWVPAPPSIVHAMAGADVIVNLSASDEVIGKDAYRRQLIASASATRVAAYVYASAGAGESSQDLVFGGHDIIAENGQILAESELFSEGVITADIDVERLMAERRRMNTFTENVYDDYVRIPFLINPRTVDIKRNVPPLPFVPSDNAERKARCEQISDIQAMGLAKRLEHTGLHNAIVGLSGGLDSTLALLVTVRAFDRLGLDRAGIHAVTMPGFGTTGRTYDNAVNLAKTLGCDLMEVDIKKSVTQHMEDIGADINEHDVTYENAQARERTQILMDIANKKAGLVIGTGDMSELALGWATYNGDHMSMYGVNAGVPKTLVRHLVSYYASEAEEDGKSELAATLKDVLDTPVSPELLPPENGEISQKTEDIVGPYELHDFFLYYMLRFGFSPSKIYRLACMAHRGSYDGETILKWMKIFYKRFFSQQFKRSCLPDGPKVGTVAVSPRGDLRMPSDASAELWMTELEDIVLS
ncbi:MAG: NAD(+) synthase [Lachnospiraceae bacterium]|nr:NAD(+) synthase [Lachnospiraceae bacterium]